MSSKVRELPPHTRKTLPESPVVGAYKSAYSTSLGRHVHDSPWLDTDYGARGMMNGEDESRHPSSSVGDDVSEKENVTPNVGASSDSVGDTSVREPAIKYEDCTGAVYRIRKGIDRTPLQISPQLSKMLDMNLYFKKDFVLPTGSFKERGARNSLELLSPVQRKKGVIAASAGNHALALAYHGHMLDIPVTVVMPITAPIMKVSRCEVYGATVVLHGSDLSEAKKFAIDKSVKDGLTYINGFNHPHILAGQGTVALEIIEDMEAKGKKIDAVVIPVGGGGLIAGMSVVFKHLLPCVEVIGVESEQCPGFHESMKAGRLVKVTPRPTLADGLAVAVIGPTAFATAKDNVDRTVLVTEDEIALAILRLLEIEKSVVEGAGATGLAACLSGKLSHLKGKNVVVVLSGGNIDTSVLGRCLDRGLAADNRLVRLTVCVSDRPGGLHGLVSFLKEQGVSVKDIFHERTWLKGSIFNVEIECVVETRGKEHAEKLRVAAMKKYGMHFVKWGKSIHECPSDTDLRSQSESCLSLR